MHHFTIIVFARNTYLITITSFTCFLFCETLYHCRITDFNLFFIFRKQHFSFYDYYFSFSFRKQYICLTQLILNIFHLITEAICLLLFKIFTSPFSTFSIRYINFSRLNTAPVTIHLAS